MHVMPSATVQLAFLDLAEVSSVDWSDRLFKCSAEKVDNQAPSTAYHGTWTSVIYELC